MDIKKSELKALELMEYPRKVSQNMIHGLEAEALEDFRALNDIETILNEKKLADSYEIDVELRQFYARKRRKIQNQWLLVGLVASLAFLICIGGACLWCRCHSENSNKWMAVSSQTPIVMVADTLPQEVTLDIGDGKQLQQRFSLSKGDRPVVMDVEMKLGDNELSYAAKEEVTDRKSPAVKTHMLRIPGGETYKLILSDGTEVYMNAGSRLIYPTRFVRKERVVTLEGEAYFKVAPDAERPFIVNAGNVKTHVLATEFNVNCYSSSVHVTLIKGCVEVESKGQLRKMAPGQEVCVPQKGEMSVKEIDLHSYLCWRDGYFYFDNLALSEVLRNIASWYNVGVEIRNVEVESCRVHFLANKADGLEHTVRLLNRMEKAFFYLKDGVLVVD